jgi:hypothetical protein
LQAIDGVALKTMVDRWEASSGESRVLAYESAVTVRQIEIGLASLLTSGVTLALVGLAAFFSVRYPAWFAGLGLLGGFGTFSAGVIQAFAGFSAVAMVLSLGSGAALAVWAALAGALMWRLAPTLVASDAG